MNHSLDSIGVYVEGEKEKMKISKVRKNEESSKDLNSFFYIFFLLVIIVYILLLYIWITVTYCSHIDSTIQFHSFSKLNFKLFILSLSRFFLENFGNFKVLKTKAVVVKTTVEVKLKLKRSRQFLKNQNWLTILSYT